MATDPKAGETLPPPLDSTSNPPSLFDGTTRLYITYRSPFAQRAWITRNCKGLQDEIKLVPLSLTDKPAWYREKVYPVDKVPSLEHDNKVIGESLDLMKYIDSKFEGSSLFPTDLTKRDYGEELWSYSLKFIETMYSALNGETVKELGPPLDHLDSALQKFDDNGPFFLGQFSLVDIAFIPFVERIQSLLSDVWKHDITLGRPNLASWIEEMNKIDAYTQTKYDPQDIIAYMKTRFLVKH
ncbi:LOW QUALITY PROTEIN: glutathione S-transferase L3 [Eucalyptus grandis]|uniref:LOW QUALITY PROTEIN: glutathione S-transferase L3 n=1 Tax=Eucalyptus grandis TaxID=71139 RepID=UPI00192EC6BB|nr:LOW QUALITY PROTEIN: glutathione S-transferase L3 [Eucalyptus grandis]